MGMNAEEYQGFLNRWLADVELATTTMRISDVAAAILLIGDRLLPVLDGILLVLEGSYELTDAATRGFQADMNGPKGPPVEPCNCEECCAARVKEREEDREVKP